MTPIAGTVLAAGAGTRMGRPKADLQVHGERLVDRGVRVLLAAGCTPVRAVVRPGTRVDDTGGAHLLVNPAPDDGLRSSLQVAVDAAADASALAVLLADLPGVDVPAVRAVLAAWRPGRIVIGRYADGAGHPVVMSPQLWSDALTHAGPDEGARAFLRARPELVDAVEVAGTALDLDTPADLTRWLDGGDVRPG